MSWNVGDNKNFFRKLTSKLRLYHSVLTTPKASPEKLPLSVVEMQQMPDIENTDSNGNCCSGAEWTKNTGRKKYV